MPIVVDAEIYKANRKAVEIKGYTKSANADELFYATLYMGAAPDTAAHALGSDSADKSLPQAYLVEQPANATIPPHFHETNQFQVFVDGEADFGKKKIKPLTVHYAGGHTPYGPIVTHNLGSHYLTLRAQWDPGGKKMPASRDLLKPGPRVHRIAEEIDTSQSAGHDDVMPVEDDGLGATLFRLKSGENREIDLSKAGGGQYAVVVSGVVGHNDVTLKKNSCIYRFTDEPALTVAGQSDDAAVLLLQFPEKT